VLLFNILHHFSQEQAESIVRRAFDALTPGGTVAIWEIEAPGAQAPASAGDGVSLFFRLTSSAAAYHGDQYALWLHNAGFRRVHVTRPAMAPGKVLVTARR